MTTRRDFLGMAALAALGGCRAFDGIAGKRFRVRRERVAINPSTLRGYKLSLKEQVKAAVAAGYAGFEPWLKDVHAAKASGELGDVIKIARDGGLSFINGIAFGQWAHPDGAIRAAGLEETKRDMAALAEMGCPRIAASMFGVQKPGSPRLGMAEIAERFAPVCDLGAQTGIRPLLEYWGHSVNMCRLEDALEVLSLVGRPGTAVLADVYHTYRGGSDFAKFSDLRPEQLPVLHVNDYPVDRPRTSLVDADRVWPGLGGAPWGELFDRFAAANLDPWLSIELFNPNYWRTTPVETLKVGVEKMERLQT